MTHGFSDILSGEPQLKSWSTVSTVHRGTLQAMYLYPLDPGHIPSPGRILNAKGKVVPGTDVEPITVTVSAPNNEDPMFSNVKIKVIAKAV